MESVTSFPFKLLLSKRRTSHDANFRKILIILKNQTEFLIEKYPDSLRKATCPIVSHSKIDFSSIFG